MSHIGIPSETSERTLETVFVGSGPVIERELVQLPATAAMYRLTMETVQHNSDMLYSIHEVEETSRMEL